MKLKCHPCCGARLDRCLKMLISLDIIGLAIAIQAAFFGVCLLAAYKHEWISNPGLTDFALNSHLQTLVVFIIFVVIDLMMAIWLWVLVTEKDALRCRFWFIMKLILECCDAIGFIVELSLGQHTAVYIAGMTYDIILASYILWVVHEFIGEILQTRTHPNDTNADTNQNNDKKYVRFLPEMESVNIV